MITLYGIKNCDTIKKAKNWLNQHNIEFNFHDHRVDGIEKQQLTSWCDELGWEQVLNRRGTTWRKLEDNVKASMTKDLAIELMLEQPAMIKRPILDLGKQRILGFKDQIYQEQFSPNIEGKTMNDTTLYSFGLGVGTQDSTGAWLEVYYHQPLINPPAEILEAVTDALDYQGDNKAVALNHKSLSSLHTALSEKGLSEQASLAKQLLNSQKPIVATVLSSDSASSSVPEVYLKFHLLSHRLAKPHETDLTGIFGLLPNVAWTSDGAIAIDELPQRQLEARIKGELLEVMSVDKFPKMTNYVVPTGVRVSDTDRVRLGAHLGEGTTIMHEGFVNFNAGTAGTSMVEGRISSGVMVGEGSDLGGGCSTMGTLSGGGNIIISVGDGCLIGANAGLGIPLGDRCTIESGLYLTAGSKVTLLDENNQEVSSIKARDLAGKSDLLFRRNSLTGRIECKTNKSAIALNEELHANN